MLLWQKLTCFQTPKRRNHFGNTALFYEDGWGGRQKFRDFGECERVRKIRGIQNITPSLVIHYSWSVEFKCKLVFSSSLGSSAGVALCISSLVAQIDSILLVPRIHTNSTLTSRQQLIFFKQFEMSRASTWQMRWSTEKIFFCTDLCLFFRKSY